MTECGSYTEELARAKSRSGVGLLKQPVEETEDGRADDAVL